MNARSTLTTLNRGSRSTSLPIVLPYAGTISVETPNISGQRAIVHFILFVLCLYFGFFSKKKENAKN
jgi:hypothetical protein